MRIRLNLATKPLVTHRRFLAGAGLIATVAAIAFLALGWDVYSIHKSNAELRNRTQGNRQQMAALMQQRDELERYFNQPDKRTLHDRAAFLNSIIDARSFDWTRMFMDLERVIPAGVRLLSISPEQTKGHVEVKLIVASTGEEDKLKFLRALEGSKEFTSIQLISVHPPTQVGNGDQEIIELTTVYSKI